MTNVARPSDLSDLLSDFIDRRPVQAVRLTDATVIVRVGHWINQNGGRCDWVAAAGPVAEMLGTKGMDRLTIHPRVAGEWRTGGLGDWVVRRGDEFDVVPDEVFHDVFDPVLKGQVEEA